MRGEPFPGICSFLFHRRPPSHPVALFTAPGTRPSVPSFLDPHSEGLYSGGRCLCPYSPARCIRIRRFDDCSLGGGADRNIANTLSALVDC